AIAFARRRTSDDPGPLRVVAWKFWRGTSIRRRAAPCRIALRFERTRNDQGGNDEESAGIHLGHDHLRADPDRRAVLGGAGSAALREALVMDYVPALARWVHLLAGITWIGLLYYFNLVQVPALKAAAADGTAAGITKHVAPRALLYFRWAAVVTWLAGAALLGKDFGNAFILSKGLAGIGVGAWLGTIMLFNV